MTSKKIELGTIIRTVVLALALINQVLTMSGHSPIPISDEQVTEVITLVATIGAAVWSWWKNNSYTQAAITGDETMKEIKQENKEQK